MSISVFAGVLPFGSYTKSCRDCHLVGNSLVCNCPDYHNHIIHTVLQNVYPCQYVRNDDGHLRCLPRGPYLHSCQECELVHGHRLFCYCRDLIGHLEDTVQYVPFSCQRLYNYDGNLMCHNYWARYPLPAGPYLHSCYNCIFNGHSLNCLCEKHDHRWHYTVLYHPLKCHLIDNHDGRLICA